MKKTNLFKATFFAVVLAFCLVMGGASVFAHENDVCHAESGQRGDINGDDKITAVDYMFLKRHILRTYALTADQATRADVNIDGKISSLDYMMLKRHVLHTYVIPALRPPVHTHEWKEADCTTPKTCVTCGETEGSAKGHNWKAATCTTAKTCKTCGETVGPVKGHDWREATCVAAQTCRVCGKIGVAAKGHDYKKGVCSACGEQDPNYKETIVYGDSPVVVSINGKEYSFMSFDEVSAVIPFKTAGKGYAFTVKDSGITYTSNGDGSWAADDEYIRSANQVTNMFKNKWCRTCGKRAGNGTHGTCVKYLQATECHQCGEYVKGVVCHTCKEE